jgi:AraC family L-rhamnose operon regulatory protein RhaS
MKAENSGLEANGCHKRHNGRHLSRMTNTRLPDHPPAMFENHLSSMRLDRAPKLDTDTCEAPFSAARTGRIQLTALSRGHYPSTIISDDTLPGLNSIGFWDGTGPQDWGIAARRNHGLGIYLVETGNMAFMADDRQFDLGAGDLVIARPWQWHQLGDPFVGPGRVHWLSFDVQIRNPNDRWRWPDWVTLTPADLAELTQKLRRNKMPVCKSTREIARIFRQTAACVAQWKNPHSISRMISCLNQLLIGLLEIPATQSPEEKPVRSSNQQVVEIFLKSLEEKPAICAEISSLREMAEQCGMGITAFAEHTRAVANVGPMEYLKQCRLNHAARQLREQPGLSITDVCFSNGFNSSQYFATCFRNQFKMSPSEFVCQQRRPARRT